VARSPGDAHGEPGPRLDVGAREADAQLPYVPLKGGSFRHLLLLLLLVVVVLVGWLFPLKRVPQSAAGSLVVTARAPSLCTVL